MDIDLDTNTIHCLSEEPYYTPERDNLKNWTIRAADDYEADMLCELYDLIADGQPCNIKIVNPDSQTFFIRTVRHIQPLGYFAGKNFFGITWEELYE